MSSRDERDPNDPDAPPSEAELVAAASLRRALEGGSPGRDGCPDRELAEAIRAAAAPKPISGDRLRTIVDASLSKKARGKVIYLAFGGVASIAAMAAAFALVVNGAGREKPETVSGQGTSLALSRSTAELFQDGIPKTGGTSSRVDTIAYARARDLRENRFARWGIR